MSIAWTPKVCQNTVFVLLLFEVFGPDFTYFGGLGEGRG